VRLAPPAGSHDRRGGLALDADGLIQRAIVLQTLCHDHTDDWTQSELEQTLGTTGEILVDALIDLEASNVIDCADDSITASRCVRRLDALGLIAS
jgi:hypothetical protein